MSDLKKEALKAAKAVVNNPTFRPVGLPPGVNVVTNASASARFPLPLTIGAALVLSVGVIAVMKGHRGIGVVALAFGGLGLGAAAAAPEINAQIAKLQSEIA